MDGEFFAILFISAVICGTIAGIIADNRGGSGVGGFFLGFLLGPIGILIACFIGDPSTIVAREAVQGTKKRCPDCAEYVFREARVCRFCRYEFAAPPAPPPPPAPVEPETQDDEPAPNYREEYEGTRVSPVLIIVLIVTAVIVGLMVWRAGQSAESPVENSVQMEPANEAKSIPQQERRRRRGDRR